MAHIEANKKNVEQCRRSQMKMTPMDTSIPPATVHSETLEEKAESVVDGKV